MAGGSTTNDDTAAVRRFLIDNGDWVRPAAELTDDVPLLREVLDSLAIVNLTLWIESDLEVALEDDDLAPANFANVGSIARLIARRR